MNNFKQIFKNKKVTVMGLGLLGRGVGDAIFLAQQGAKLTITDLKPSATLRPSLQKLRKYKGIKYVLGKHRLGDFKNCDLVLKAAGVPFDSIYIKEAKKHNIPVEMSATLFSKFAGIPMVGVTGTRGKSTVTHLIVHILKSVGKKVILGGNVRGVSNLQLLKKAKGAEIAVFELDSWQLQGFGDSRMSPHISVFTNFLPDHLGYYKGSMKKYFSDKANIFKYQKSGDLLIVSKQVLPLIKKFRGKVKSKVIVSRGMLPRGSKFNLPGVHNEHNASLAVDVVKSLSVSNKQIKKALSTFTSLPGRLNLLRTINGIKIYNDNSSTTPDATIAALRAVGDTKKRKIVLIIGGNNKSLDMGKLLIEIPKYCSKVVLFKERGTDLIRDQVFKFKKKGIDVYEEEGLFDTTKRASNIAEKGEVILYSPASSSFGKYFQNEYDRGEKFLNIVKRLK